MAAVALSDTHGRVDFFQRSILSNLQYWSDWLEEKPADTTALDQERNNIVKAVTFALEIEKTWTSAYNLIITLSPYMERRGYWESWAWILQRAINVARRGGDQENEADLSALLGLILQRQSRFKEAIAQHRRTIRIARQTGNQFALARACTNLGYLCIDLGHWRRSEVLCCAALQLFKQIENDYGLAHTENHLGVLYLRQQRWADAQQHFERACEIWRSMEDDHGLLKGLINLSALHIKKREHPEQSLSYLEDALHLARRIENEIEVGVIYENTGLAHKLIGNLVEAEINYQQAEAIFQKIADAKELARVWSNLGNLYILQRKWSEAIYYLKASLKAWRHLGNRLGELNVLFNIVDYELARGNSKQAAARLKELEKLIEPETKRSSYQNFHARLNKYRDNLGD